MKKAINRPVCVIVVVAIISIALMIAFQVNISNIRAYDAYIPKNVDASETLTIGKARAIRSDEWLVTSSNIFYELHNPTQIDTVEDAVVRLVNISEWMNGVLSKSRVFAYKSLWAYLLLFLSALFFFYIFEKKNWIFVLCAAGIITMQPGIAWWNSAGTYAIFFSLIDLFYYFFYNKKVWQKILCCFGLIIGMGYYIVNAYPAWMIPLGYYAAILLIAIFLQTKEKIRKTDIIYIIATILAMAGVAACYFISKADFIEAVTNTEYPGKRISVGGGIDWDYIVHYMLMPLAPFRDILFINNSEASTFYSFFPIPFILYLVYRKVFKEKKIIALSLLFSLLCYVYAFIGFPTIIAKVTMWSMTTSYRVCIIGDLAMLVALIFEVYYLSNSNAERAGTGAIVLANAIELAFLISVYFVFPRVGEYLGIGKYILLSIALLVILNLIMLLKNKLAIALILAISVGTSVIVNPVNVGTDILDSTPLAKEITALEAEDSGNWITNNDWIMSKYIKTQGAECLNALNYPPDMDLYGLFDENGNNSKIYNRYAHVVLNIDENKPVEFKLLYDDRFEMSINSDVLKAWDVKYIISKENIEYSGVALQINKVYADLDGYDIYKVAY